MCRAPQTTVGQFTLFLSYYADRLRCSGEAADINPRRQSFDSNGTTVARFVEQTFGNDTDSAVLHGERNTKP
jgi:hypothetical protein